MELIRTYFPDLDDKQIHRLSQLRPIYQKWNARVNLISRKDEDHLYEHHVLHSLSIAKLFHFHPGTRILDAGTGGGFPGIPLAILLPEIQFILVDSIRKKTEVVQAISDELALNNTRVIRDRIENLKTPVDFVVSRAVTQFPTFYQWTRHLIRPGHRSSQSNGIIYLKGGDIQAEISAFQNQISLMEIFSLFPLPYFESKKVLYLPVKSKKSL